MILICWTGSNLEGLVKTFKFLELASSNMLAITNLAVCINLALIVSVSASLYAMVRGKLRSIERRFSTYPCGEAELGTERRSTY